MLEATKQFFTKAADHLDLSEQLRTILLTPRRVVRVEIVTESDDGGLLQHIGYRVQHNNTRGPMKGGCDIIRRWTKTTQLVLPV